MEVSEPLHPLEDIELYCLQCDYNLTGSSLLRCPWCGWEVDVEELLTAHRPRRGGGRFAVAFTAIVVGLSSLTGFWSLLSRDRPLSVWDGLIAFAVLAPAVGHLALGLLASLGKDRWPMRRGDAAGILRLIAGISVPAAILGARPALGFGPTPNIVQGIQVNGVLEFFLLAAFASIPSVMLLLLTMIAFRPKLAARKRLKVMERPVSTTDLGPTFTCGFARPLRRSQVRTQWLDSPPAYSQAVRQHIAEVWEHEIRHAAESGRQLYDGQLVRLSRFWLEGTLLNLELGPTAFRDFVGTHLHPLTLEGGAEPVRSNALGISAVLLTPDGFLALGRRSPNVLHRAGFLHTFGGLVELVDRDSDGGIDVFNSIRRELTEELGLTGNDFREVLLTGLVQDRSILQPELLFDVQIRLTREQLRHNFAALPDANEHTAIEFMPDEPDSVVPFLSRVAPVTPVAEASILLHGLHQWGQSWYEQTCFVLYGDLPA